MSGHVAIDLLRGFPLVIAIHIDGVHACLGSGELLLDRLTGWLVAQGGRVIERLTIRIIGGAVVIVVAVIAVIAVVNE